MIIINTNFNVSNKFQLHYLKKNKLNYFGQFSTYDIFKTFICSCKT